MQATGIMIIVLQVHMYGKTSQTVNFFFKTVKFKHAHFNSYQLYFNSPLKVVQNINLNLPLFSENKLWSVFIPIPKKGNAKECSNY